VQPSGADTPDNMLAVVRAITTIDADGDAAWHVLAVSDAQHTLRQVRAEWPELTSAVVAAGEGVGVASPLLFVALGAPAWVRQQAARLRQEADGLRRRLSLGESDLADEQVWLERPLRRRAGRFTAEVWRALALQQLLAGDDLAQPGYLDGEVDDRWLFAFYAVSPEADADDLGALAGRAIEAWLYLSEGQAADHVG
jgi:hypothetical protein